MTYTCELCKKIEPADREMGGAMPTGWAHVRAMIAVRDMSKLPKIVMLTRNKQFHLCENCHPVWWNE